MRKSSVQRTTPSSQSILAVLYKANEALTPEDLFRRGGYNQDTVDDFYAELRRLTESPKKVEQFVGGRGILLLRALP